MLTPSSGDVNIMSNGSNSLARFTCHDGYEMIGTSEIACLSDGSWDGTEPTCGKYLTCIRCEYLTIC